MSSTTLVLPSVRSLLTVFSRQPARILSPARVTTSSAGQTDDSAGHEEVVDAPAHVPEAADPSSIPIRECRRRKTTEPPKRFDLTARDGPSAQSDLAGRGDDERVAYRREKDARDGSQRRNHAVLLVREVVEDRLPTGPDVRESARVSAPGGAHGPNRAIEDRVVSSVSVDRPQHEAPVSMDDVRDPEAVRRPGDCDDFPAGRMPPGFAPVGG